MSIEEKLFKTRFVIDSMNAHIRINKSLCLNCQERPCLTSCPVQCYKLEKGEILFTWENCVECGTCRIVCPLKSVEWNFPRGGFGVCYRFG